MLWPGNRYERRNALLGFCCLWLLAGPEPAGATKPGAAHGAPRWPLDLPTRYLTSNFMEYRAGRFHAGLDLKTQSRSGFAARAVEDGSIVRVRATPFAYGRAVYLLGASGRTYVYAHLSRFNDDLRARVRAVQAESGTYRTRLNFAPGQVTVRRGDVLGLTGESGTNGPHLHFEVRDPGNGPVNPLGQGFAVPDTFAPVIHALRAIPADTSSRIDGRTGAALLKGESPRGLTGEQPALVIRGPVAFAAKIIDASDIRAHKLEPYLIEVRLDGKTVYRCRNDRYDFADNSLQRLEWLEVPDIRDRWLHRRPANSLTGRQGGEWYLGDAGSGLAAGRHELVVRAADFAGNESSVTVPLRVAVGGDTPTPSAGGWLEDPVGVLVDSLSDNSLEPLVHKIGESVGEARLRILDPDRGDPVLARTELAIAAAVLDVEALAAASRQGLEPAGPAARYLAADWPIDAAVVVRLPGPVAARADSLRPSVDPALGVYRWKRDEWKPVGPILEPGPGETAHRFALSDPGLHAVFLDEAGPLVAPPDSVVAVKPGPERVSFGVSLPRWEVFPVGLVDAGSGIAPESIRTLLDGRPLVVEPDLPRDRILVELPDDLAPGRHVLRLEVRDEAGNGVRAEVLIDCRE